MRIRRPRGTIPSLMIAIVGVAVGMAIVVADRDYRRRCFQLRTAVGIAKANCLNARLERDVADIALAERAETFRQQRLAAAQSQLRLPKTSPARAMQTVDPAAIRLRELAVGSDSSCPERQRALRRAQVHLEEARARTALLIKSGNGRAPEALAARAIEAARKAEYDRARAIRTALF
jgi:hypothetical protein